MFLYRFFLRLKEYVQNFLKYREFKKLLQDLKASKKVDIWIQEIEKQRERGVIDSRISALLKRELLNCLDNKQILSKIRNGDSFSIKDIKNNELIKIFAASNATKIVINLEKRKVVLSLRKSG